VIAELTSAGYLKTKQELKEHFELRNRRSYVR
jgi:hypothetical protein